MSNMIVEMCSMVDNHFLFMADANITRYVPSLSEAKCAKMRVVVGGKRVGGRTRFESNDSQL